MKYRVVYLGLHTYHPSPEVVRKAIEQGVPSPLARQRKVVNVVFEDETLDALTFPLRYSPKDIKKYITKKYPKDCPDRTLPLWGTRVPEVI